VAIPVPDSYTWEQFLDQVSWFYSTLTDPHIQPVAAASSMQQGQYWQGARPLVMMLSVHLLLQVKAKLKLSGVAEIYFSSVSLH
jgi:hypothetical protein